MRRTPPHTSGAASCLLLATLCFRGQPWKLPDLTGVLQNVPFNRSNYGSVRMLLDTQVCIEDDCLDPQAPRGRRKALSPLSGSDSSKLASAAGGSTISWGPQQKSAAAAADDGCRSMSDDDWRHVGVGSPPKPSWGPGKGIPVAEICGAVGLHWSKDDACVCGRRCDAASIRCPMASSDTLT